jgi:hypothetical protein
VQVPHGAPPPFWAAPQSTPDGIGTTRLYPQTKRSTYSRFPETRVDTAITMTSMACAQLNSQQPARLLRGIVLSYLLNHVVRHRKHFEKLAVYFYSRSRSVFISLKVQNF